jgi:hypothetical protein
MTEMLTRVAPMPAEGARFWAIVSQSIGILASRPEGGMVEMGRSASFVIYGFSADSEFPEDMPMIERLRSEGRQSGWWFSEVCPQGEWGANLVDRMEATEITREQFMDAFRRSFA